MRLRDIAEKYQGVPENSKVIVPGSTTQHTVFLCRHSPEEYNNKYYQSAELSLAEVKNGWNNSIENGIKAAENLGYKITNL
jgi:oligoribonuclease (3'-5' exoribonuclease)